MIKIFNNKGFSLVEMLIAIVVTSVILGAIMMSFTTSLRVFKDAKSISDNIETKTPSVELISRYFDRWGVGVVSRKEKTVCHINNCPVAQKTITISTSNDCADVTFYGNLHGFGFVRDVVGTTNTASKLISCRLNAISSNVNCYTLWRNNSPLNDLDVSNNLIPLSLESLSSPHNADCSQLPAGTTQNATMDDEMSPRAGNIWKTVKPGDVVQRAAHKIKLYCANNSNDANRKWLYVDLTDQYGYCTENENASPIAPVDNFNVQALPSGCNAANGECKVLNVTVTFRSPSQKHDGTFDTFTITKVFGR